MAKLASTDIFGNLSVRGKMLTDLLIEKNLPRLILSQPTDDGIGIMSGIEFRHQSSQNVLVEHVIHDGDKEPFGVRIKKSDSNTQQGLKAFLDVEGKLYTEGYEVYHTGRKPSYTDIGAAAREHSHNYLPLTGGTITGAITINGDIYLGTDRSLICPNGYGIIGEETSGSRRFMLYMGENNIITLGHNGHRVDINDRDVTVRGHRVYHEGFKPVWSSIESKPTNFQGGYLTDEVAENKRERRLQFFQGTGDNDRYPDANWWSIIRCQHNGYVTGYWQELAFDFHSDIIKYRRNDGNDKFPWKTLAFTDSTVAKANLLATARTINGVSFNGGGNITITAAPTSHTHDDRYFTESEINTKMNTKVSTTEYSLTTITKTLTVSTAWIDTGIAGTNLETGSYVIQMHINNSVLGMYNEQYSGIMSWYKDTTNSEDVDEILLHKAGHASTGRTYYLRTARHISSGRLHLEISCTHSHPSGGYQFKFRKLI